MKVKSNERPSDAALREAQRRWGKSAWIRKAKTPSDAASRIEAKAKRDETDARLLAIDKEIKERLAALDWYVQLTHERAGLTATKKRLTDTLLHRQCHVGVGVRIMGWGDSWEEAFVDADKGGK